MNLALRVTSTVLVAMSTAPFHMQETSAPLQVVPARADTSHPVRFRSLFQNSRGPQQIPLASTTFYALAKGRLAKISETSVVTLQKPPPLQAMSLELTHRVVHSPSRPRSAPVKLVQLSALSAGEHRVVSRGVSLADVVRSGTKGTSDISVKQSGSTSTRLSSSRSSSLRSSSSSARSSSLRSSSTSSRSSDSASVESGVSGLTIAKYALDYVGRPYTWGGASPAGFDCSGLVQYVYGHFGIVVPRTSYQQFQIGRSVTWTNLLPGDLVFFTTDHPGASHVAIYIGNGLMVQALNPSTGVIVSHLHDPYYRQRFIGARRLTG